MRRSFAQRVILAAGLSLSLAGLGSTVSPVPAILAAPPAQIPSAGAVIGLSGTSHLWIADAQGLLHWAGDTRALAGKAVQWGTRTDVTLDQLKIMKRGDPWLSSGLLKSGDPIYMVKWETDAASPQLLRIQSIADVELFGITSANYGALVLEEAAWRQLFTFDPAALVHGTLPAAAGTTPAVMPAAVALVARQIEQSRTETQAVHVVEISGATPGTRLQVSGTYDPLDRSRNELFPIQDAGAVSADGTLTWRRTHPLYTGARYTFTDPAGNTVTIVFKSDL